MDLVFTERFDRSLRQARVNRDWRFYFKIIGGKYYLVDITAHPK